MTAQLRDGCNVQCVYPSVASMLLAVQCVYLSVASMLLAVQCMYLSVASMLLAVQCFSAPNTLVQ